MASRAPQSAKPSQSNAAPSPISDSKVNPPIAEYRYPEGQTFTYSVDWRLLTAGTTVVHFDTVNGERHVVVTADSTGAVALLYHVQDKLETFFNPPSNCALQLIKHTEEGFRRVETSVRYDYQARKAILDERNIRAKNQKHEENDISPCVANTVSAALYVGSQPLQPGTKFRFPSSDGGKAADIEVTVEGREKVKTPSGSYNTIRVSAEALNGPQKGKGKIWIWYSDDQKRMAVQMRLRAFWGTIVFHLAQVRTGP
ncbi:MAG TPA: DUF3108 domain-containing protein [Candidatus Sulfotelmatobacter sp.]|nr:DUF3108 domain-containing protein [Candidatus Sulfotelmatobacter sp.]